MYAVLSKDIDDVWDDVIPFLKAALEVEGNLFLVDDIYYKIIRREMQLWVAFCTGKLRVFGITTIRVFPQKKIATLVYVGGHDMPSWEHLIHHIHDFAKSNDCSEIEVCGRTGWERALKTFGYERTSVVLRKVIHKD